MSGAAPAQGIRGKPLVVLFFTVFLDLLGFGIVIPVLPFYAEQYGADAVTVTALGASYSLMQFLFAPMWGRISDRVGRRPVLLVGVAMSGVGYAVFGLAHGLVMLFAARILSGIGNANIPTAQAYIADVTTPENRAKGMGLLGMAFGLGFLFGPPIGGAAALLGEHLSAGNPDALLNHVSVPAFAAAFLSFVDLVLAFIFLPEPPRADRPVSTARRALLSPAALKAAMAQPVVATLLLVNTVFILGWSNVEGTFGLLIERMFVGAGGTADAAAQSIKLTSLALTIVGVTTAFMQGGMTGRLTRTFGERRLLLVGLGLQVVALGLLSYAPTFAWMVPVLLIMAAANGLVNPSSASLLSRAAPAHEQGLTLGLGQSLSALARVIGPVFGGWLFQTFDHHAPYVSSAALVVLAGLVAVTLPRPQPAAA